MKCKKKTCLFQYQPHTHTHTLMNICDEMKLKSIIS